MFENDTVVGRFEHVAAGIPGGLPRVAPFGAQGRSTHSSPRADAHGYILSPLRG